MASLQCWQSLRTRRWARTPATRCADEIRLDAEVEKPGDGAGGVVGMQRAQHQMAGQRRLRGERAVSLSRISPTMMTSGSCRSRDRRALANVKPAFSFT